MPSEYRIKMGRVAGMRAWSLSDTRADLHGTWVPGAGMLGASLLHAGDELLWQGDGVRAYARERMFMGIPFLHPWANRLDRFGYEANGHRVVLNRNSPLLLLDDHGLPIHGVLTASRRWVVHEVAADSDRARLVSRLDFDRPELLEAFPFPHRVELAVEVSGGAVQLTTTLTATGSEPVPVAFGFHPYFHLPGLPRARWEVVFPVRERLPLDLLMVPTGATEPASALTGAVGERTWDDEFDGVDPGACFQLSGGGRTIEVHYTDGYPVAQIFAPPGAEYVCVEPMTALANALEGPDDGLRWVPVGEQHSATFRIVCRHDAEALAPAT